MIVYYCAKCRKQNSQPQCGQCGRAIGNTGIRFIWMDARAAIADTGRVKLAALVSLLASVLLMLGMLVIEYISRGTEAFSYFFTKSGLSEAILMAFVSLFLLWILILALQGREKVQYVMDSKGVLKRTWVEPNRLNCLMRSLPYQPQNFQYNSENKPFIKAHEEYLLWADAARYELSPVRRVITLYRPYYFVFMSLHLPGAEYDEAAAIVASRLKHTLNR